jgi:transcriptional regulator with XRE-family HTH domain
MYHRALRIIREYHRLPQKETAESLGISKSYLSEIEGGKKQPSLDILEKYSIFFKIPLSSILLFAETSASHDAAERFRGFAADKILKILDWIQASNDIDQGADDGETQTARLPPVRHRLADRPSPPSGDKRGNAGAPR